MVQLCVELEAGWTSELVWAFRRRDNYLARAVIGTPDHPASRQSLCCLVYPRSLLGGPSGTSENYGAPMFWHGTQRARHYVLGASGPQDPEPKYSLSTYLYPRSIVSQVVLNFTPFRNSNFIKIFTSCGYCTGLNWTKEMQPTNSSYIHLRFIFISLPVYY